MSHVQKEVSHGCFFIDFLIKIYLWKTNLTESFQWSFKELFVLFINLCNISFFINIKYDTNRYTGRGSLVVSKGFICDKGRYGGSLPLESCLNAQANDDG